MEEWEETRNLCTFSWVVIYVYSCCLLSTRRLRLSSVSSSIGRCERAACRQLIRDTMSDNIGECRSSGESAANGSQLISVYYSTGVRARGRECT